MQNFQEENPGYNKKVLLKTTSNRLNETWRLRGKEVGL